MQSDSSQKPHTAGFRTIQAVFMIRLQTDPTLALAVSGRTGNHSMIRKITSATRPAHQRGLADTCQPPM